MYKITRTQLDKWLQTVCDDECEIGVDETKLREAFKDADYGYIVRMAGASRNYAKHIRGSLALYALITMQVPTAVWFGIYDSEDVKPARLRGIRTQLSGKEPCDIKTFGSYYRLTPQNRSELHSKWNFAIGRRNECLKARDEASARSTLYPEMQSVPVDPDDCAVVVLIGVERGLKVLRGFEETENT